MRLSPLTIPDPSMVAYKRRTCTKASLPGILGGELWKETPLNGTAIKPTYQQFTLLFLALSSPPVSDSFTSSRCENPLQRLQTQNPATGAEPDTLY